MPDAMSIIREVAEKYGVSVEMLRGKGHRGLLLIARTKIYIRLRTEKSMSLQQIGNIMGGRDHSTIAHAIQKKSLRDQQEKKKCHRAPFHRRLREASSRAIRDQKRREEERRQGTPPGNRKKQPVNETRPTSS